MSSSRVRVLCIGILVADVFIPPLARLPDAGELVATDDFLLQPGGCAANVAVALGRLGVRAAVCGRVGDDVFGDFVVRSLHSQQVDTSGVIRTEGCGTSKTVIVPVVGEDRRFVHSFGANVALTAGDVDSSALAAADVVYIGGYLLLPGLDEDELAAVLREARTRGAAVVLDVAAPAGRKPSLEAAAKLLPLADYFVPNFDEAYALTGESDPRLQADRLIEHGALRVLIKLGDHGVYARNGQDGFEIAAPVVPVIEPSGAGDAFAAGLILGILEDWDLERTVRFASVVGASACTALGCSAGVFTRPEADEFIALNDLPVRP